MFVTYFAYYTVLKKRPLSFSLDAVCWCYRQNRKLRQFSALEGSALPRQLYFTAEPLRIISALCCSFCRQGVNNEM